MIVNEPEVNLARRSFPEAQRLLAGVPGVLIGQSVPVGWYGADLDEETTSFAVVRASGLYASLVGDIIRVGFDGSVTFAYVHRSADAGFDLALCRRAFLNLGGLWRGSILARVEVV